MYWIRVMTREPYPIYRLGEERRDEAESNAALLPLGPGEDQHDYLVSTRSTATVGRKMLSLQE